jgi:hypothetical protein
MQSPTTLTERTQASSQTAGCAFERWDDFIGTLCNRSGLNRTALRRWTSLSTIFSGWVGEPRLAATEKNLYLSGGGIEPTLGRSYTYDACCARLAMPAHGL